jgi:hypothetical protein
MSTDFGTTDQDDFGSDRPARCLIHGWEPELVLDTSVGKYRWDSLICPQCELVKSGEEPEAETDIPEDVEEDDFGTPRPPGCERHGWEASLVERLPNKLGWDDLICPFCTSEADYYQEIASAHVETGAKKPPPPAVLADVSDVTPADPVTFGDMTYRLTTLLGIEWMDESNLTAQGMDPMERARRLANISIAEKARRFYDAAHLSLQVYDAYHFGLATYATHLFHLMNQEMGLKFFLGGDIRWFNPSLLYIAPSGGWKGVTMKMTQRSVRHVMMVKRMGRCTIQGLIGTVRPNKNPEKDGTLKPGGLSKVHDGLVLFDEAKNILNPQGAEAASVNNLYELLSDGQSEIDLGVGEGVVHSWAIFMGGMTPEAWEVSEQVREGLIRRILVYFIPLMTPEVASQQVLDRERDAPPDRLLFAMMEAQFSLLRMALTEVTSVNLDEVAQWVAQAVKEEKIRSGDEAVYYALAIGHHLIELDHPGSLHGELVVSMTPSLQKVLETELSMRKKLYEHKESAMADDIGDAVERRMTVKGQSLGTVWVQSELAKDVAAHLNKENTDVVVKAIRKMIRQPGKIQDDEEADELLETSLDESQTYKEPLRKFFSAEEATDWVKDHPQLRPLPPSREHSHSPRLIWVGNVAAERVLDEWRSKRREGKRTTTMRKKPYD